MTSEARTGEGAERRAPLARLPRDERRAQLLVAALEVFVNNGYHGAAMDEIAEAAKVSKPVLYQHFPSKRELYVALLESHLSNLKQMLITALNSTTDNKLRVQATMKAYFQFVANDDQAYRLVFESDLVNDHDVAVRLEKFNSEFADALGAVIAEDTLLGRLEAVLLGRALSGMAQVSARYWLEANGDLDLEVASDLVYRLAWRGISRFPKEQQGPSA
ncbi:TetR/AcrR family transcriptional regulator [Arthrobacter wenxiniae]|jgi:AcrR family transcriptional regulator|uniref:TetR/AcrR family transcriptional regulator n=1 Tax=Arthrobacter wenxiniae TaxID=2713570 RepID=A0A7Y7LZT3_9MICC|nr:TetR/AcrR family transcriptional regulator [Arthrobacter wenxiniae]NVM95304.1 TetR/AcrR family transcriptional regulator [Arthrobacter wenxiniae]